MLERLQNTGIGKAVEADPAFIERFKGLQQAFIYITDECNLSCEQCLYKPWLRQGNEISISTATALVGFFHSLGASKLSILGGEPTQYEELPRLVEIAKNADYQYVRMDTNGNFRPSILQDERFKEIDEITFSLDGNIEDINNKLRGDNTFDNCAKNIRLAASLGYNVNITSCVHRGNIGRDQGEKLLLDQMIEFASDMGVKRINFHPLFRMGVPRDDWAGDTDITPKQWIDVYLEIMKNVEDGVYQIDVRIPQRFVSKEKFDDNPAYYGYCPVKMGERVLVHANGMIQICALMIGTPFCVANYREEDEIIKITEETINNEIVKRGFDVNCPTSCTNQTRDFGEKIVPLCISFKPNQKEYIWERLDSGWVRRFKGEKDDR